LDKSSVLRSDQIVIPSGVLYEKNFPDKLRRVEFVDTEKEHRLNLLRGYGQDIKRPPGCYQSILQRGQTCRLPSKLILIDNKKSIYLLVLSLSRYSYLLNMDNARKLNLQPPILSPRFAEMDLGQ